jgi:hypothetical protein
LQYSLDDTVIGRNVRRAPICIAPVMGSLATQDIIRDTILSIIAV